MNKQLMFWTMGIFLVSCHTSNKPLIDLDGNTYPAAVFGQTEWMLENLQVTQDTSRQSIQFFYPDSLPENQQHYGLLYDFETACKICPKGWELPYVEDWEALLRKVGDSSAVKMKDVGYWKGESNTNDAKFSARPAGYGNSGEFDNVFGQRSIFWSSDYEGEDYWTYVFAIGADTARKAPQHPVYGFSVRCIKK
ncbi:MAG: fibrobacter succinogenes major paralogous domain-containing protein [Bacteroidota bacterium]